MVDFNPIIELKLEMFAAVGFRILNRVLQISSLSGINL